MIAKSCIFKCASYVICLLDCCTVGFKKPKDEATLVWITQGWNISSNKIIIDLESYYVVKLFVVDALLL